MPPINISMNTIEQYTQQLTDLTSRDQVLEYLIYLGESLPEFNSKNINKQTHVRGCQNNIWATCQKETDRCYYSFHSDSKIVRGVCKILLDVYNSKTATEVTSISYYDFRSIASLLTHERQRGMQAIINRIHRLAKS